MAKYSPSLAALNLLRRLPMVFLDRILFWFGIRLHIIHQHADWQECLSGSMQPLKKLK